MSVTRKLSKCGNSVAVIVPPALLELLGWKVAETDLELRVDGSTLTIAPEPPPKFKLFGGAKSE